MKITIKSTPQELAELLQAIGSSQEQSRKLNLKVEVLEGKVRALEFNFRNESSK